MKKYLYWFGLWLMHVVISWSEFNKEESAMAYWVILVLYIKNRMQNLLHSTCPRRRHKDLLQMLCCSRRYSNCGSPQSCSFAQIQSYVVHQVISQYERNDSKKSLGRLHLWLSRASTLLNRFCRQLDVFRKTLTYLWKPLIQRNCSPVSL